MTNPQNFSTVLHDDAAFGDEAPKYNNGVRESSPLSILTEQLAETGELELLELRIPLRKKLMLVVDPNIDGEVFQQWQRRCILKTNNRKGDVSVDGLRFSAILLANTTIGVKVYDGNQWVEVHDEAGQSLNFRSGYLKDLLAKGQPVNTVTELVRHMFGKGGDAHLMSAAAEVTDKAGFAGTDGDELDENPTMG